MSNLTSSVPLAFNALYDLLRAAGEVQSPPVPVYHTEVVQQEPAQYVLLGPTPSGHKAVENHSFEPAAIGSYAHYETYDICGFATYFEGNIDPATAMANTWSVYQSVVMSTVVANRGQPGSIFGSQSSASLLWVVPAWAEYDAAPGDFGGGPQGFQGVIEFAFSLKARITVP